MYCIVVSTIFVQHLFNGFDVQMRDSYISNKKIIVSKFIYLPKCKFYINSKKEIRNETIVYYGKYFMWGFFLEIVTLEISSNLSWISL